MRDSCEFLKEGLCTLLDEPCFTLKKKSNCAWRSHYSWLQPILGEPKINSELKQKILPKALEKWKSHAKNRGGGRSMTARPFEDSLGEVVEYYLEDLGVQVDIRKKKSIIEGFNPIVDVLIKKEGYPTSFILAKTYLGQGELRECFGNAYFMKSVLGSRDTRCFVVTIPDIRSTIKNMIELIGLYFDGVYSLSCKPPVDDLINELRILYKPPS